MTAQSAEQLRHELRSWLASSFTSELRRALRGPSDEAFDAHRQWNAILFDAGYAAVSWPEEFGGREAPIREQLVCAEEMARAGAPGPVNAIGVANIAPSIMSFGTAEQKDRFLRPMLRGDEIWSQGMSEPEAGSDLASLRCRAAQDGDHYVVNGQKTWNSMGDRADWCQLYVRTDPDAPKHKGISALLVDMRTPGIEARPIVTMAGDTSFSELFFTEARVPVSSLLGAANDGWSVATKTLSHERAGVATLYLNLRKELDDLVASASDGSTGARPVPSALTRDQLMARYIDVRNLEFLAKRALGAMLSGRAPGPEGSVIKLAWSLTAQSLARTAADVLGVEALDAPWSSRLLSSCSLTIAGGTTEVNKNILGERVLGLPRESRHAQG
ncbi:MAG TPA: acyl-CoA dehydrogenase family protein [Acidimicrobiales bacterium]